MIGIYDLHHFTTISTAIKNDVFTTDYQLYIERNVGYRLSSSCLGVLVGYILVRHNHIANRLNIRYGWIYCVSVWIMLELLCFVYVDGKYMPLWIQIIYGSIGNLLWLTTASWVAINCYRRTNKWSSWLNNKCLNVIGNMWYSIYLCHGIVLQVFLLTKEQRSPSYFNKWLDVLEITFKTISLGIVFYCIVESPAHQISKKLIKEKGFPANILLAEIATSDILLPISNNHENIKTLDTSMFGNGFLEKILLQGLSPEIVFKMVMSSKEFLPRNVSSDCKKHLTTMFNALYDQTVSKEYKAGALQMIDSIGKPPSSVLKGNYHWLGSFEQCINASLPDTLPKINATISGKYCVVVIKNKQQPAKHKEKSILSKEMFQMLIVWGTCLPSICTHSDIETTLSHYANFLGVDVITDENFCQTTEGKHMNAVEVLITVLFYIVVSFVVLATMGDYLRLMCAKIFEDAANTKQASKIDTRQDCIYIFSARTSIMSLFDQNETNSIYVVNGIRGVAILGVIITHINLQEILPLTNHRNYLDLLEVIKQPMMSPFSYVFVNVNVFFTISGFCLSYVVLNDRNRLKKLTDMLKMFIRRYVRMTIPYLAMMAFIAGPYAYTYRSAAHQMAFGIQEECQNHMFKKILYLPESDGNTLSPQCVGGEWFIAADLQAYIVIVILVYLINTKPKIGIMATGAVMLSSIAALIILITAYDVYPFITLSTTVASKMLTNDYQKYIERRVIYRLSCSCMGILFGYVLVKHKQLTKRLNIRCGGLLCWSVFLALELMCHVYVDGRQMPKFLQLVYGVVLNAMWSGVAIWTICQTFQNPTGKCSTFFSNKWIGAIGKLSYSIYLCHGIVHQSHMLTVEPRPASYINSWLNYLELIFKSTIAATVFYCIVESPFDRLSTTIVTTDLGPIKGLQLQTDHGRHFWAFRAIPYAKPPLKRLRFKPPQSVDPWDEVLDATEDSASCIQIDLFAVQSQTPTLIGDEDCLFLNIYTPKLSTDTLLPVMVFIHGGGYTSGNGSSTLYGPERLLDRDIILVTINYRLGIFGFISTGDEAAPGNYGLLDQVMALKWVQQYITKFGGDPSKVTIFGQSAGGASVSLHLVSPLSKGLFHAAIQMSGNALCDWAIGDNPLPNAITLAESMQCPTQSSTDLIQCLEKRPALELLIKGTEMRSVLFPFIPVVDRTRGLNAFLPKSPNELLISGEINMVPVMSGFTSDEAIQLIFLFASAFGGIQNMNSDALTPMMLAFSPNFGTQEQSQIIEKIRNVYFKNVDESDWKQRLTALTKVTSILGQTF
ncbi:hypothetical protein CHUAL_008035 [Chamberlinius hualienensis]